MTKGLPSSPTAAAIASTPSPAGRKRRVRGKQAPPLAHGGTVVKVTSALSGQPLCTLKLPGGLTSRQGLERVADALDLDPEEISLVFQGRILMGRLQGHMDLALVRRPSPQEEAFQAFRERWPGALRQEFLAFLRHTCEAFVEGRRFVFETIRPDYGLAAFVVQIQPQYCDFEAFIRGCDDVIEKMEVEGFRCVDATDFRVAFQFVPRSWGRFQELLRKKALELRIPLKRVMLCWAPAGLDFVGLEEH